MTLPTRHTRSRDSARHRRYIARRPAPLLIIAAVLAATAVVALGTDYDLAKNALLAIKRMAAPAKTV